MSGVLCDSGPLIASFNPGDRNHDRAIRFLAQWPGATATHAGGDFEIVDPTSEDRLRASELVTKLGMASPVSRLQPLRWVLQES